MTYYGYVKNEFLDSIELSVRADRVLRTWGKVNALDDFMALKKSDVMALKGAGARTWREIREIQEQFMYDQRATERQAQQEAIKRLDEHEDRLRDEAALVALQGLLSANDPEGVVRQLTGQRSVSVAAWAIADALIAAREGETDE